jgi:hypothetical protein
LTACACPGGKVRETAANRLSTAPQAAFSLLQNIENKEINRFLPLSTTVMTMTEKIQKITSS